MRLIEPSAVRKIDGYVIDTYGVDEISLINRAGVVVAAAARDMIKDKHGASVVLLIGSGNNGADGCAAALALRDICKITLVDMSFGARKSEGRMHYESSLLEAGLTFLSFGDEALSCIENADLVIEAVFGSGLRAPIPEWFGKLAECMNKSKAGLLAVDTPLGVDALTGAVTDGTPHYDRTLALSFMKCGVVSFPGREYSGELLLDSIGIDALASPVLENETPRYLMTDALAAELLPHRPMNSSKGSFGRLLTYLGSERYFGASALALEAALRGGAGYVTALGTKEQNERLMTRLPEAIYKSYPRTDDLTASQIAEITDMSAKSSVTLVGCGCDNTEGLLRLVRALLSTGGGVLVLDADAINALAAAGDAGRELIRSSRRELVLTPHPLELSRLIGIPVDKIQCDRMRVAESCARELGVTLVLKGAGTVVTDSRVTYVNSRGSSALAKAGSGDVLAGTLSSMLASGGESTAALCALAVYFHSAAADSLAAEYSDYGVIPSDLPKQIAREIAKAQCAK